MSNDVVKFDVDQIPEGMVGIRMMLGMLQGQITNIQDRLEEHREESRDEHRKVHTIIDATGESMRNLTRAVTAMEPHVESYKMSEKDIKAAVDLAMSYRDDKIEKRGTDKVMGKLITAIALIVSGAMALLIEGIKFAVAHFKG
mgnify:CR=1 FL=1